MTHRRRIVIGSAAWLIAASAGAATKHAKGAKGAGAKKVALVDDAAPDVVTYGLREDVVRFAEGVAERRELDVEWVKASLGQARFVPAVTRYIMPPTTGTAKNWGAYRARFVEPIRIRAGVAFWRANQRWLGQAEDLYGVAPEIVVGIVGVESIFGRQMGDFRVIDALATLAFDFPSGRKDRSAFFKDELEAWFAAARDRVSVLIYVDTLEFLRRGGRIGRTSQVLGGALGVRPLLTIRGGRIEPYKRALGRAAAMREFDRFLRAAVPDGSPASIGLAHADDATGLERLREIVQRSRPQASIDRVCEIGAVVGTHGGPGTLGMLVLAGE